jgi:hypothetical protein
MIWWEHELYATVAEIDDALVYRSSGGEKRDILLL